MLLKVEIPEVSLENKDEIVDIFNKNFRSFIRDCQNKYSGSSMLILVCINEDFISFDVNLCHYNLDKMKKLNEFLPPRFMAFYIPSGFLETYSFAEQENVFKWFKQTNNKFKDVYFCRALKSILYRDRLGKKT